MTATQRVVRERDEAQLRVTIQGPQGPVVAEIVELPTISVVVPKGSAPSPAVPLYANTRLEGVVLRDLGAPERQPEGGSAVAAVRRAFSPPTAPRVGATILYRLPEPRFKAVWRPAVVIAVAGAGVDFHVNVFLLPSDVADPEDDNALRAVGYRYACGLHLSVTVATASLGTSWRPT